VQPQEQELAPITALKAMRPSCTVKNPQPRNPSGSRHSRIATSPASWITSGMHAISAVANSRRNMSRIAARPSTGVSANW
jgi:hypothetical protein